ncbi:MAG TPA: carboxypeptidase regulatory-like domain-containing protein [Pyrinomonadaceae bacterium]|nr:carboxypeptidase regulatory-like domain-containing protein [Pyrinomonadaceae bacterium]
MKSRYYQIISGSLTAMIFVFFLGVIANAQEITGSINGTVRDSAGAVVSGATVTITDAQKDNLVVRTVTTNEDGAFSAPNLRVSVYRITVEAANFKKSVNTDIKLDVGQRRTVDIQLEAGNIAEVVTVEAAPVAVELTTPTASTLISGDQVRELSINNRNFVQLVTLAPGVSGNLADQVYVGTTNPEGQANTVPISVNGARSSANTFTVDGADITDRGSNLTIQAYPSVDSIGEFKVLRSLYPAESGRSGGGQINVVTRSGTDQFHGSLFEFVRNDKFNASSYFNNRNAPLGRDSNGKAIRPPFRYNNYGFTVGGPIYFLRFGDFQPGEGIYGKVPKTYFFFSEEQRKDRRYTTLNSQIPNANLRQGVFTIPICLSGTITGTTRACTQVLDAGAAFSSIRPVNPIAQQYINYIYNRVPLPNNGTYGLSSPASARADFRQEIIKIDTSFTNNWSAYYRYQRDTIPTIDVNTLFGSGSGIPGVSTSNTDSPGRAHTLQTSYVINPKLIVEGRYVYSYGAIVSNTTGLLARANSPISVPLPYTADDDRVPQIAITNLSTLQSFGPYNNFSDKHEWSGNLTWILGSHTFKFGGMFSKYRKNEDNGLGGTNQGSFSSFQNTTAASATQGLVCVNGTPGSYTAVACAAGDQTTQQTFANFLLGNNVSFTQTKYRLTADFRQRNFEGYAQDEYRAFKNLTLYYGVRYSFYGSPWAANGLLTNFVPELFNRSQAPLVTGAGNRVAGTGNYCNGIIVNAQNYQTGPSVYNCTPIASPYGQYVVDVSKKNFAPRVGLAWDPWGTGKTSVRTGYGIYHEQTLIGTFETHLGSNPPYQETITVNNTSLSQPVPTGSSPTVVASNAVPALIRGVDTDYKTPYYQHWSLDWQQQWFKNTLTTLGYYGSKGTNLIGVVDLNLLQPGYALTQQCAVGASTTPTAPCQARDTTTNLPIPFTASPSTILDQIRPYRGWRGISMIQPRFNSNYHSLQLSATQRFSGASQVQIAYTWAKNLTDNQTDRSTAPMDVYNIRAEYGRAQLDRRHVFTLNYIYELPFFQKQNDFVGKVLGGWQASGIVTYQTGLPFTATYGAYDPAGIGFLNASSPAGGRPFLFGNPNDNAPHTFTQWFNTSVFQNSSPTSAAAVPGNAGRGIIEGPPTFRVDFTMSKNIRFTESMYLQLRGEAFNVFNRTNFTTLGLAASTPSTFGTVTGTRDPRILQFGIKFYF